MIFSFIVPEDEEFKLRWLKLEIPMPAAMPCKTSLCRGGVLANFGSGPHLSTGKKVDFRTGPQ